MDLDSPGTKVLNALVSAGRLDEAEPVARQLTQTQPQLAAGWKALGGILGAQGRFIEALPALQKAVSLLPGDAEAHNDLAAAFQGLGRLPDAEQCYRRAADLHPDWHVPHSNLGSLLVALGRLPEAAASFRRAIAINPGDYALYNSLGNVLLDLGQSSDAESSYLKSVGLKSDCAEAHGNLGLARRQLGRHRDAESSLRQAIQLNPVSYEAHIGLGALLQDMGRFSEAEQCYRQALTIRPDFYMAHCNLGSTLRELRRPQEAKASFLRALELRPEFHDALIGIGLLYTDSGRASEAEPWNRRALLASPDSPVANCNLACVLGNLGRVKEAEALYRRALQLKPDFDKAHSDLLFSLAYSGSIAPAEYLEQARNWELASVTPAIRAAARHRVFANGGRQNRKLRIGYVSGDFRGHPVSVFVERILEHHCRDRFEVFAYSTVHGGDGVTESIRRRVDHWHVLAALSDDSAADLIGKHQVDVLIDLSGHTAHNRIGIFARRAAPVQCEYLGYFASTGLTEMDFLIADPVLIPEAHDTQYCERVWRLPRVWISYVGAEHVLIHQQDPHKQICLGSFNHLGKVTERTVSLWSEVLQRLPGAHLLMKTRELEDVANRERIFESFEKYGVPRSRIELLGRTSDWASHMALYNRIDIALDPVGGHGGCTTTCDALWMGVPVVTLTGGRYGHRMTHSILASIGREEWSATSEAEYVDKVVRLAADPSLRNGIRLSQRDQIRGSPLSDAMGLTRALESAYEAMFDYWASRLSLQ